jgi:hypothetical protein
MIRISISSGILILFGTIFLTAFVTRYLVFEYEIKHVMCQVDHPYDPTC